MLASDKIDCLLNLEAIDLIFMSSPNGSGHTAFFAWKRGLATCIILSQVVDKVAMPVPRP
jgi:hypothetical protein